MAHYRVRDDYAQLHSGAHRKPAAAIGTPALTRHIVLWVPERSWNGTRADPPERAREAWKQAIDDHLHRIYLRINALNVQIESPNRNETTGRITLFEGVIDEHMIKRPTTNADRGDVLANDYQVISFRFQWQEMTITLRAELHTEYWSLSVAADLSRVPAVDRIRTPAFLRDVYRPLGTVCDHLDRLESLIEQGVTDHAAFVPVHQYLYDGFWQDLFERLVWPPLPPDPAPLGSLIADFRGLLLGALASNPAAAAQPFFQPPLSRTPDQEVSPRPFIARPRPLHPDWAAEKLEGLWPFMAIETQIGGNRIDLRKYEFTASRVLGGRAIFATALGAQPTQATGSQDIVPLFYLIYTDVLNTWQIGRLVDRIHHLGTLRLTAIMDVAALRKAGQRLRSIANNATDILSDRRGVPAETEAATLMGRIALVQAQLAELRTLSGRSLEYRIERSRYYAAQFRANLAALRIKRIEGFQPYDVFVERRLGAVFAFIDMLGIRYDRVQRDLEVLSQYAHSQSLLAVSRQIMERNKRIEDFQATGETLLLFFLVPYYLGNLLVHIFGDEHEANREAWVLATLTGAFLGVIKIAERRPGDRLHRAVAQTIQFARPWVLVLSAAIAGTVWVAMHQPRWLMDLLSDYTRSTGFWNSDWLDLWR